MMKIYLPIKIYITTILMILGMYIIAITVLEAKEMQSGAGLAVKTLDGQQSSFKAHLLEDKWNIVFVWTTYCQHCTDQYPFLSELHEDKTGNLAVLGICLDKETSIGKIKSTQRDKDHRFPSVIAEDSEFADAYEINTGEPFTGTPTYLIYQGQKFKAFLDGPTAKRTIKRFISENET